ncbi:MAG: NAD-dependent epimerase/dehydratase family protein [Thermodesulfobacteriota bacterium]
MRILVTGASGYIGAKLVEALGRQDWVEQIVGTDIKAPNKKYPKFKFHLRDVRRPMDDLFASEGIDTVAHTAYVLPPIHNRALMEDINKGGTRNILTSAKKFNVRQILYTSSTTAYGFHPDNDVPLTEESPLRGNDDMTYAKNKKEIEWMISDFSRDNPSIHMSVVRPCIVIGPEIQNPIAEHLRKKLVVIPANTSPWQFVHEDDLIAIMTLLLEKRMAGIFNVAAEGALTFNEMIRMLGNRPVPVPWSVIYPLNGLAWRLRLKFVTRFPSPAMRMMVEPWIASSEKLIRQTGYQFKYDSRAAFSDFVRAVKKEPS